MNADPTIDEMRETLTDLVPYADEFTTEAAIYWFASDYHSGQGSDLYKALCASPYTPGALEAECPEDAQEAYECLEETFSPLGDAYEPLHNVPLQRLLRPSRLLYAR
jgi:hypothetical protein